MNPKVDFYFQKHDQWHDAVNLMRDIVLSCGLEETLKWGQPCYTLNGANVIVIHSFKEYCAYLFFKGALVTDPNKILIQQTENTQATRQIRFTNAKEVKKLSAVLKSYIYQAIDVERSGMKVELKKTSEYEVPEEFQKKLNKSAALKKAFAALTPGRQRAYLLHFAAAKQSSTREARVEKCIPSILAGEGLNDT